MAFEKHRRHPLESDTNRCLIGNEPQVRDVFGLMLQSWPVPVVLIAGDSNARGVAKHCARGVSCVVFRQVCRSG